MQILVLGGNGYLGSKIIERLSWDDQNSILFTRRSSSDMTRIEKIIAENQKVKGIPASVEAIEAVMAFQKIDIILNMACSYGRKSVLYNNVIEANIDFPLRVLNKAVECGTKRFLTIGTGLPDELNMYSFSKKMFSEFGAYYAKHHGIDFYNLKLEMFYGADEPTNRFIPSLILKMLRGDEVNVTVGTQHRDIISVNDILHAIEIVITSSLSSYQEISVGTGVAPSISELVDFVWEETGRKSLVRKGSIPMRENEPDCIADTRKLRELGSWNPVDWKLGIHEMILQIRERGTEK